ncbi:MAG: hypothetical protein WBQ94_10840 [Terracidiphilus sp.]
MEHDESVNNQEQSTPTDTHLNSKTLFGLTLVFYAILELEFLRRLWSLIGKHAPLDYAVNGVAFEACFIASAFSLWRCLHLARAGEEAMRNYKKIMSEVTVLVMMLLLSLMQFSSFTQAYDKIRP